MTARHHHYLSQCYLKGFTKGGAKKSKLTVIDLEENRYFETIPRNVGGIRDFNRISDEGVDQNILEKSLSDFEGAAASALRKLEEGAIFEGEIKDLILNLLAMVAIRSPQRREHFRQFQAQIAERVIDLALATKERWESQIRQLKKSGADLDYNVTYEDMKMFYENKEYSIEVARERHIHLESVGIKAILPCLFQRNWLLVKSTSVSGSFITTDNPANLTWNKPDKIPQLYRSSPGYGMKDTQVYFPVSKNIALIGEFDGHKGTIDGTREIIADLNSKILMFTYKQLYAPNFSFYFRGRNGEALDGIRLLNNITY